MSVFSRCFIKEKYVQSRSVSSYICSETCAEGAVQIHAAVDLGIQGQRLRRLALSRVPSAPVRVVAPGRPRLSEGDESVLLLR